MFIPDAPTFAAWGTGAGTFLATFAAGAYGIIRRVRKNATQTATVTIEDQQKKIDKAVGDERKRQDELIKVLQNSADAYKDLAAVRQAQKDDLQTQFNKLSEDFKKIRKENAALVKANSEMVSELAGLRDRLEMLEKKALPNQ